MKYCPNCGFQNKFSYNFCHKCGKRLKKSVVGKVKPKDDPIPEFRINEYITLKLKKGKTIIYIKDKEFLQCKYLLIEIPIENIKEFKNILSIDELSEKLDHSLEEKRKPRNLSAEAEFWGHCSNLQTWFEHGYDTRLLHSNLSFPLLKKLTDVGDPIARMIFKDEIAERMTGGHTTVSKYLIEENYLEYFNKEESDVLMEYFKKEIAKDFKSSYGKVMHNFELSTCLDLINENIHNSKILIVNRFKRIDILDNTSLMGFTIEGNFISKIALNRCGLQVVPDSIENLKNLNEIYLTENMIREIPESFGSLVNLGILNLSKNKLKVIPESFGNLSSLEILNLNHNQLEWLPNSIKGLKNLKILSLWGNNLSSLPEQIGSLSSLNILGVSYNLLKSIPDGVSNLKALHTLDLSNNALVKVPDSLGKVESLHTLWLNNNHLKILPSALSMLTNLKDLYLVNNPLVLSTNEETKELIRFLEKLDVNIWK
ncbi:MAG: leucine-rich repeat domain protein [Candidatus Lokiarchaeum sp. GC14_75]|nr:MAG: leucine-rich repeat domain protein [Candidatus Lokiarchaeum sp. GC14_75]